MIVDAHCHVWEKWPYQPAVPDPAMRARVEQLLFEMDANGVERAVIICAAIADNTNNADYAFAAAKRYPDRLIVFPDLECRWAPDYRQPGAIERLRMALERWEFSGCTLYLEEAEDGAWLTGEEGMAFFRLAAEHRLVLSLSIVPRQISHVIELARRFPQMPILLHHFAFLGPRTGTTAESAASVLRAAAMSNIFIKFSGMGNVAAVEHEYPYEPLQWIARDLAEAFGASRVVWGSDYPVSRRHMTYAQTLSLLTRHGPFTEDELPAVLGGNMLRLLNGSWF